MAYNPLAFGLLLIGTGALLFAAYLFDAKKKISFQTEKNYGIIFSVLGFLAGIFGLGLYAFTPIPEQYIEVFGVGYLVFSFLSLVAGITLLTKSYRKPSVFLAGIGGVFLLGSACVIYSNQLTRSPLASAALFALAGLSSIGMIPYQFLKSKRLQKIIWIKLIIGFTLVGLLAIYTGLSAQAGHVASILAG
ncbi:MAG: DUF981 family protein [Nanoarchaeota archaeon]|nr:DUF981 family protein [Nanoarchaeota archaeon]